MTSVTVPLESADVPFAFQKSTADFQSVSIQGLRRELDKRNFRRKLALLGILKPLREWQHTGRKPAQLFRFAAARF
jgi:hypothetical protein